MNKETEKIFAELEGDPEKLELEELRRDKSLMANLESELETLSTIFPELSAEDIPDEVFAKCDNGKGLAAQYALAYLKKEREKTETAKTNEVNKKAAIPEIKQSDEEVFFTPEMVKSMSDKDIRQNYKAIMKSMEKWTNK